MLETQGWGSKNRGQNATGQSDSGTPVNRKMGGTAGRSERTWNRPNYAGQDVDIGTPAP